MIYSLDEDRDVSLQASLLTGEQAVRVLGSSIKRKEVKADKKKSTNKKEQTQIQI